MPQIRNEWLLYEIERRGKERGEAAREMGIDPGTMSGLLKPNSLATTQTAKRISRWMAQTPVDPNLDRILAPPSDPQAVTA